uniref:Uncharacterized protein n=1 Tax=viral metagenome TaxID=1070528 RepID=A0A6H2A4P9_9ZZZZ
MVKIKEESWTLTSADTVAIPAGNRADGVANKWSDIWKYQVPTGQAHVLKPEHRFAAYVRDTSPAEVGNGTCRIKIVIRDQSESDEKAIYGPALYVASKEFQDVDKMARLALQRDLAVEEKFYIALVINDDAIVDQDTSYFKLETSRFRSTI